MSVAPNDRGTVVPHPAGRRGTLRTAGGDELPVRTFDGEREVVLVVLTELGEPPAAEALDPATLEYTSLRGVVRLRGEAVFTDHSLARFRAAGDPQVIQRREFVRVPAACELAVGDPVGPGPSSAHTLDISGGGMLLFGATHLAVGDEVGFALRLGEDEPQIAGVAGVVRIDPDGRRALQFRHIAEDDRQRLIRFVFTCLRAARAKTRGHLGSR
jgi:hypothetical protein